MTRKEMREALPVGVIRNILTSGRMPVCEQLGGDALKSIRTYFAANPDVEEVWYTYAGKILSREEVIRLCSSRTGQLVFISTHGWPLVVSRWACEYCLASEN